MDTTSREILSFVYMIIVGGALTLWTRKYWSLQERLESIASIALQIEKLGHKGRSQDKIEISPHILEDWGVRLCWLATENSTVLDANRQEVVVGNPAKYQ